MRACLNIILVILLSVSSHLLGAHGLDSLKRAALSSKLEEYFSTLRYEPIETQKRECDFLIESSADSLVRQYVAQKIYEHYIASRQMGVEAVAIHVLDKWFIPGTVKMENDFDFINAKVYADFNRQSLIGCRAPELDMTDMEGGKVSLFTSPGSRFSVLFFYDADCSKCKMESILLRSVLEDNDFPLDFYAIYVGDNKEAWSRYVSERFDFQLSRTGFHNLWDPSLDSDFQRKYGLLQTPRMFLVAPDGTIVGRGLDAQALLTMLLDIFREVELDYGGKQSERLFEEILSGTSGPSDYREKAVRLVDYITEGTLPKGDTVMFRQLSGDLLYYLSSRSGEGVKNALGYLIDRNVFSRPEVWKSKDDSLKVVGFAQIMSDLLSKSPVGTKVADIKVPGQLLTCGKSKDGRFRLDRLKGDTNIIIFYTEGCEICKVQKQAARELVDKDRKVKVLLVNVDELSTLFPSLADRIFSTFDLTSLPFVLQTDKYGVIERRYMSLENYFLP